MPNEIQSSFIPKQNLTKTVNRPTMPVGLLTLVAFLILGVSVLMFAGAFAYKQLLYQEINRKCSGSSDKGCGLVASIERERERLDYTLLTRFRRFDAKSKIAKEILDKHATLMPVFKLLNDTTLETIQYTKFTFTPAGINLEGVASSYEDIALQSQVFGARNKEIKSFIFSGLDLDQRGNVVFKLLMTIDPAILSYRAYTAGAAAPEATAEQEEVVVPPIETPAEPAPEVEAASTTPNI
jgi:hypothetical protein